MGIPFDFQAGEGPVIEKPRARRARTSTPCAASSRARRWRRCWTPSASCGGSSRARCRSSASRARRSRSPPTRSRAATPRTSRSPRRSCTAIPPPGTAWPALLAEVVGDYLRAQVEAGAQALQLFDSWVGALDEADYREFVLPHVRTIFAALRGRACPSSTSAPAPATCSPPARGGRRRDRPRLAHAPRRGLAPAWARAWPSRGTWTPRCSSARATGCWSAWTTCCAARPAGPGHVFNLGHGILPGTPVENVKAVVDHVHERTAARA